MKIDYPKNIVSGKDGFLFHPWYTVFEQLCQASLPTERIFTRWKLLLEARHAWCEKRNIRYVTLVIPERHVIYEDQLPDDIKISQDRAVIKLKQGLESTAPGSLLYPEAELKQARGKADVCFRTDEHLSPLGYYTCYKYLLEHLVNMGISAHDLEDYSVDTFKFTGNIGIQLETEPSEQAEEWYLKNDKFPPKIDVFSMKGQKYLEIMRRQDKTLPTAIFFGDSNLEYLKRFLNPHFSKLTILPIHKMFYDLAAHEQPDLIMHVVAEHRLGIGSLNHGSQPPYPIYADIDMFNFESYCDMSMAVYDKIVIAELAFNPSRQSHLYFLNGWGELENDHHWMLGSVSRLALDFSVVPKTSRFLYIEIKHKPFLYHSAVSQQRIRLSCKAGSVVVNLEERISHEEGLVFWKMDLSAFHDLPEDILILTFEHPDGVAPNTVIEDHADGRLLSFCVSRVTVYAE